MQIDSAAITTMGLVRKKNEDRYICDSALGLYAIADGIGGLPAGAAAAQCAIDKLLERAGSLADANEKSLQEIISEVNESVCRLAKKEGHAKGIGTTLTFLLGREAGFHLVHLGDSACFQIHRGKLAKLTTNHTVETELLKLKGQGRSVPFVSERARHALVRCIGQPGPVEADISYVKIESGDRFLVCSDGLSEEASDAEVRDLLTSYPDPQACLDACVDLATSRGGVDNMTAVAVFVG